MDLGRHKVEFQACALILNWSGMFFFFCLLHGLKSSLGPDFLSTALGSIKECDKTFRGSISLET